MINSRFGSFFSLFETGDRIDICNPSGIGIEKEEALILIEKLKKYIEITDFEKLKESQRKVFYRDYIKPDIESQLSLYRRRRIEGCVYFARRADGLVKIGCSANFKNRIKVLKREFGDLECIRLIDSKNMYITEAGFHLLFKKKRKDGEWFNLSNRDVDYIKSNDYYRYINITINGGEFNFDLYYEEVYSKQEGCN